MRWECEECGTHAAEPGTCPMCGRGRLVPFSAEPLEPERARAEAFERDHVKPEGRTDHGDGGGGRPRSNRQ